jgi:apolipoprotein N-acyltransferase
VAENTDQRLVESCPWFKHIRDLFEPWLLLPYVFTIVWMATLLRVQTKLSTAVVSMLGMLLSAAILSTCCVLLVWSQDKEKENMKG